MDISTTQSRQNPWRPRRATPENADYDRPTLRRSPENFYSDQLFCAFSARNSVFAFALIQFASRQVFLMALRRSTVTRSSPTVRRLWLARLDHKQGERRGR